MADLTDTAMQERILALKLRVLQEKIRQQQLSAPAAVVAPHVATPVASDAEMAALGQLIEMQNDALQQSLQKVILCLCIGLLLSLSLFFWYSFVK